MKSTFWKNNKIDQQYEITDDQIKERYLTFLSHKDDEWTLYYGDQTVLAFIGANESEFGLQSVCDRETTERLIDILKPVRHKLPVYKV